MGSSRESRKLNSSSQGYSNKSGKPPEKRYRDLTEIGNGATSTVYRARDTVQNRDVALKILTLEIGLEWDVLVNLVHPSIVTVFERGRIPDPKDKKILRPFIAMELLTGVSLKTEIPRLRSWTESVQIIRQCGLALAYLHEQGKCHLDLKPSNVHISRLVSTQLSGVKVLDFGLSEVLSVDGVIPGGGTYAYMSPEQIGEEQVKVNEASDVFSLGVLSYEILTRCHPFASQVSTASKESIKASICELTPSYIRELSPQVPEPVAFAIHRTLAKDSKQRPSAADLCMYLDTMEPFARERAEIEDSLEPVQALLRTDVEKASRDLERLERQGWAFPEIVLLRHKIISTRADLEVQQRVNVANHHLQRGPKANRATSTYDFQRAEECLKSAQKLPSRRFDVRVLLTEARVEWERRVGAAAKTELDFARKAVDQGEMRKAEWHLGRLNNLEMASPAVLTSHQHSVDALMGRIADFYLKESAILDGPQGTLGSKNNPSIPPITKAVQARALQAEAKRQELILRKTLELVGTADPEKQKVLIGELDSLRSAHPSDAVQVIAEVTRKRQEIIHDLRQELLDRERLKNLAGALQTAETLLKIVPDKELESKQVHLREEFDSALHENWLEEIRTALDSFSDIGDYDSASQILGGVQSRFPKESRFFGRKSVIDDRLYKTAVREQYVCKSLEHLKEHSLEGAIEQLGNAKDLEPSNHVLAVSLAGLLARKVRQQALAGDPKASVETQKQLTVLLNGCEDNMLLIRAINELRGLEDPQPAVSPPEIISPPLPPPVTVLYKAPLASINEAATVKLYQLRAWLARLPQFNGSNSTAWLLGAIVLVSGALAIFAIKHGRPVRPTPIAVSIDPSLPLTLTFDLVPSSASIQVDGTHLSGSSVDLKKGLHLVRISAPGYDTWDDSVNVIAKPAPYKKVLTPSPVALSFDNTAETASVFLDGGDFSDSARVAVDQKQHRLTARFSHYGELEIRFNPRAAAPPDIGPLPTEHAFPIIVVSSFGHRAVIFASRKGFPVSVNGEQKGEGTSAGLALSWLPAQSGATLAIGTGKDQRTFRIEESDLPLLRIFIIGNGNSGSISILSNEEDSQPLIDGQPTKRLIKGGRLFLPRIPPGDHSITVTKAGFCTSPSVVSVAVKQSEQVQAKFDLQPIPSIRIDGRPPGTRLLIDGRDFPGSGASGLPLGLHSAKATAPNFSDFTKDIQISCGSNPILNLAEMRPKVVVPPPPIKFRVTFAVDPTDATVTLLRSDKTAVSERPSTSPLSLDAGVYTLHVARDGYESRDESFTLQAGGATPNLKLVLKPVPAVKASKPGWSPELVSAKGEWQKALAASFYGDGIASGAYTFRIRGRGFINKSYGNWIVGYVARNKYFEFRVHDGKELQWRSSGRGEWIKSADVVLPAKAEEISVRINFRDGTVTTELGRSGAALTEAGDPVPIPSGRFGIAKDVEIAGLLH